MSNFIQEIKNHNINKALSLEMVFRTSDEDFNKSIDMVADTLNKSFLDGLVDEQAVEIDFKNLDVILEKARPHKYYRREGSPGNYKYYYTKEEYEQEKKKVEGGKEGLRINESQRKTVENKPVGSIHEYNGKKYKKQANGKWLEVSESHGLTKKEHEFQSDVKKESVRASDSKLLASIKDKKKDSADEELMGEKHQKGDKIEFNGVTIHVGKDTSGGQDILTYKSPDISDKTFYDLSKLKEKILEKTLQSDIKKESASLAAKDKKYFTRDTKLESAKLHSEQASKLSDKEYSDEEVGDSVKVYLGGDKQLSNLKVGDKLVLTKEAKNSKEDSVSLNIVQRKPDDTYTFIGMAGGAIRVKGSDGDTHILASERFEKKGVNAIITLDADRNKRNKEFVEELKKIDPNSGFTGGSRHGKRSIELTGDKDKILELMDKHGKDIVADFYED